MSLPILRNIWSPWQPAKATRCNAVGFGLHSFGRANITMRQEVGGSAIEASKIAGHATVNMTGDCTVVQLKRQDDLTRRIQQRLDKAKAKVVEIKRKGAAA